MLVPRNALVSTNGLIPGRSATREWNRAPQLITENELGSARPLKAGLPAKRSVGILLLMQPHHEVVNAWRDSAPFWEKHREIIRQMFAPVTQALVDDGQIGGRQSVLDIATGPGEPALTIAALIGPEGRIFGIDPVPEMVEAARRAA